MWVRQTHLPAIIILWVWHVSSSDTSAFYHLEFDIHIIIMWVRQKHRRAIIILWVRQMYGKRKIAEFRTHDLTKGISYVSTQSQVKFQWTLKFFKRNVSNWPDFEYSRIKFPSLSSGCEIAHFFVRYMDSTETLSCYHCLVSLTDTSACYYQLVSSTDTSSCYHHLDSS